MLRKLQAKSIEKYVILFAALVGVVVVSLSLTYAEEDENPVIGFYVERGQHAFETRSPIVTGTTFSLKTRSYYKRIGEHGAVQSVDSADIIYYYSWGKLDSSRVISGDADRFKNVDLSYPDVFARDYRFYLFPNDVGGPELAIGFDTHTEQDTLPDGLILIDREQYYPLWLYLYYPVKSGYARFSRSLRFTEKEGKFFPDSVWEVGAKRGLFFSEYYRLETGVMEIDIERL